MSRLKTLTDWKKMLKPGQSWIGWHHVQKRQCGGVVARVQGNAVTFRQADPNKVGEAWLYFPKAKQFRIGEAGEVMIFGEDGQLRMTYRLETDPVASVPSV